MPRYEYKCLQCDHVSLVRHSIKEKKKDCDECEGKECLIRIPNIPIVMEKKEAGKIVRSHIEETKNEIKEDKQKMREEEYKP